MTWIPSQLPLPSAYSPLLPQLLSSLYSKVSPYYHTHPPPSEQVPQKELSHLMAMGKDASMGNTGLYYFL